MLSLIKTAIFARRSILKNIMEKHGDKTLYEYSRDFMDVNSSPRLDARKYELITVVKELVQNRLGEKTALEVATQLTKLSLVSTADHHGFIDHPFWVNSNIISALPMVASDNPDLRHLVVFSFASVSLNNASAFPRGVEFHGGWGNFVRLPLLPDKLKMGVVYATRGFGVKDIELAKSAIGRLTKEGKIMVSRSQEILQILQRFFEIPEVLAFSDLNSQITRVNFSLWPKFFHPEIPKDSFSLSHSFPQRFPNLIYLEIETIVREILLRYHLFQPDSLLYRLFFHPEYRTLSLKLFDSIPGAFSFRREWGSYMFWGLDSKNHRVRLRPVNGTLQSYNGQMVIPFTPEGIAQALMEKKIFPGMLLCYLVVSLYYGMKCLGGFCQVHDLTMTKRAWMELLKRVGENDEAKAVDPVQTKELGGDGMVLAYIQTSKGGLTPATGFDMIMKRGDTSFARYMEVSKHITLLEAMKSLFPEMYTVLYPIHDRVPALVGLLPEQILEATGLQDRFKKLLYETRV